MIPRFHGNVHIWAEQLRRELDRIRSALEWKRGSDVAAKNGIILWDEANGWPVVTKNGAFVPLILEDAMGPDITHAQNVIFSTYGDAVSVSEKKKSLNKFGYNDAVGTSWETVAVLQGTTSNETFVSTNIIDAVSSSSASDTSLTFTIEGHTIDGSGNLTFVVQDVTTDGSDGRTPVAIGTPLARANRIYLKASGTFNSPQSAPVGSIYVYDNTDGDTAGVPDTAAATKVMLNAGETQSEKAGTSISSTDYWILTGFGAGIGEGTPTAGEVQIRMETRDVENGGAWRPLGRDIVAIVGQTQPTRIDHRPYRIIPKNHDWRIIARTDSGSAPVFAEAEGYLAAIV